MLNDQKTESVRKEIQNSGHQTSNLLNTPGQAIKICEDLNFLHIIPIMHYYYVPYVDTAAQIPVSIQDRESNQNK